MRKLRPPKANPAYDSYLYGEPKNNWGDAALFALGYLLPTLILVGAFVAAILCVK